MDGGKDLKRIERLAKSLLLDKEIPSAVMDKVRVLLNNDSLPKDYRYREIISLIQHLPDKKVMSGDEIELREEKKPKSRSIEDTKKKLPGSKPLLGPTESSLYVDPLILKFKGTKLFKKRYLVHRNNKFGIGFRKRLIPTRNFKHILDQIADLHETVIYSLSDILDGILFDQETHDPSAYNYLKEFYRWMANVPLLRLGYDKIVWMERKDFDREFKEYITYFFSFYKMGTSARENIIQEIEGRLRGRLQGLKSPHDDMLKEKEILRIVKAVRFFLPASLDETGPVSSELFSNGDIRNLPGFLFTLTEALIFQRNFSVEELIDYYRIVPPAVSRTEWDCNEELLEKAGKNRLQQIRAELDQLKQKLGPLDSRMSLLAGKDRGELILYRSVREYWRIQLNKNWQLKQIVESHFYLFVYSVIAYYIDVYSPLISGSPIRLRDYGREEMEGTLFSPSYFEDDMGSLAEAFKSLKSIYAGKAIPKVERESVRHALAGAGEGDEPAIAAIADSGGAFYRIGTELLRLLEAHRIWKFNGGTVKSAQETRSFLDRISDDLPETKQEKPIPYHDCLLLGMSGSGVLGRELNGKAIIDESTNEGIFVSATSFFLQAAHAFMNGACEEDIQTRNDLARRVEDLSSQLK